MSEEMDKLRATLSDLENELQSVESLDQQTADMLRVTTREIQEALDKQNADESEHASLVQGLRDTIERFEGSHPTLTGILSRIVDGLAQMGI